MESNIYDIDHTASSRMKVVVIGGGFAGLNFVKHLDLAHYDVTLVDRNNYHSFPPLFYQVASSGLDPASICFPLRRELRKRHKGRVRFNMGEVESIDTVRRRVRTPLEDIPYDILVVAAGTTNNFFNMGYLEDCVYTMKSTAEALRCRNDILALLERASLASTSEERRRLLNFVVIGGGPTGVEIAGAIGEMKRYILPREYPAISQDEMSITIVEGADRLLRTMSEEASASARESLESLMVNLRLGVNMKEYSPSDCRVTLADDSALDASMVIWTAGVTATPFKWITAETETVGFPGFVGHGGRLKTDTYCRVEGFRNVYALGDIALMSGDDGFPAGHPQLAQVALQQGKLLARNLNHSAAAKDGKLKPFRYKDKGSMATVGRNRAVVDLKHLRFHGFSAWLVWMFIHLISILGMRNKITVLINWIWAYFNYSSSLRLLIQPSRHPDNHDMEYFYRSEKPDKAETTADGSTGNG